MPWFGFPQDTAICNVKEEARSPEIETSEFFSDENERCTSPVGALNTSAELTCTKKNKTSSTSNMVAMFKN